VPELIATFDAFIQEHRPCGDLHGGVDRAVAWLRCDCGALIARPVIEDA